MTLLSEHGDLSESSEIAANPSANQFVTFTAGQRDFGIDIMSVREIRSWTPVTELPSKTFGGIGVLDIRGKIVEVFDLQRMLGGHSDRAGANPVFLVVSLRGKDVGLLVDTVSDIVFAQAGDLRDLPDKNLEANDNLIAFLVKIEARLVAILNLAALFPSEAEVLH